MVKKIEKN